MKSMKNLPETSEFKENLQESKESTMNILKEKNKKPSKVIKKATMPGKKNIKYKYNYPFGYKMLHNELVFQINGDYPDVIRELKQRG